MCYAVRCSSCGKTTWSGCGMHVASVYNKVQDGQHCLCRQWPGIKPGTPVAEVPDSSICTIL
uniref:Uncharacterized protein n=1 Tax=Nelumbo nucifera TaxID=4432 RepID=A0A822YY03_NELNU|nr:TPA_asm: hypothetical protein HUJ06_013276 [Nelumbo nucifera]